MWCLTMEILHTFSVWSEDNIISYILVMWKFKEIKSIL